MKYKTYRLSFIIDKFDPLQFVNLRCTACHFDAFIHYSMIAIEEIFIIFYFYSIVLMSIFIVLAYLLLVTRKYRPLPGFACCVLQGCAHVICVINFS